MAVNDYPSIHSGNTIDTRVSQVATNTADIAALKSRMNSAEADIDTKADATSVTALSSQVGGVLAKIPSEATTANKLADKAYVDSSVSGKASQSDLTNLTNRVTAVEGKIPSNASSSNQLADKSFVNTGLASKQATLVSGTNIATINGQSLLNGGNIVAGDPNAVKYVSQSLTESQKAQARTNIGAASAEEVSQLEAEVFGSKTEITGWTSGKNIYTNQGIGNVCPKTLNSSSAWRCIVFTVQAGATYIVNGQGGSSPRLWCFLDAEDKILSVCVQDKTYANDSLVLTPPEGATQLIINSKNSDPCYECFEGEFDNVNKKIDDTEEGILAYAENNYLVGDGQNFVYRNIYGLVPGRRYRVALTDNAWDITGITGNSNYKFSIVSFHNDTATNLVVRLVPDFVLPFYEVTVPADSDYVRFGGRAVSNVRVQFDIYDVTDEKAAWPKAITEGDALYKVKTASNRYTYIFPVGDKTIFDAYLDDDTYTMLAAVYGDFNNALTDASSGRTYVGNGYYATQGASANKPYKFGTTNTTGGWLAFHIKRTNSADLSSSDITAIESAFRLNLYPQSGINAIRDNDKEIRLLNGQNETEKDLHPFVCSSSGDVSGNAQRVKFFDFNLVGGKKISINISGILSTIPTLVYSAGIYASAANAISASSAIESLFGTWQSANSEDVNITKSGILSVYFKKSDDSYFSVSEFEAILTYLSVTITSTENGGGPVVGTEEVTEFPIGNFTRADGTGETLSDSTTVVSSSETCVPHLGITYKFALPSALEARVVYGAKETLGTASNWLADGGSVTVPATGLIQRFQFRKANGNALTLEEMATFVSGGLVKVTYTENDLPVHERNYDAEKYAKAMMYRLSFVDSADVYANVGLHSMATLVHISDTHGDVARFANAYAVADLLGVDAIVSTGDNVVYNGKDGSIFLKDVNARYSIPFLTCIGNHEVYPTNSVTESNIFDNHISPYVSANGYKEESGTPTTHPYYFIDISAKKLRVIVLNQFDSGCYGGAGLGGRLGKSQVSWICDTLLSTPSGYGVIIAMHSPEDKLITPNTMQSWNQTVNWDGRDEDTYGYAVNGLYVNEMRPIKTIVDAFISKTAISTTYDENTLNGNNGETVTIDADFSLVAEGVEFVCYITGHRHKDNIGYLNSATNLQLCINVVCGNCHYPRTASLSFSEGCDIPRGDTGVTQDAFNVYAIDRQNGRVKIARIGSSVNFEGIERKFLLAPYKD